MSASLWCNWKALMLSPSIWSNVEKLSNWVRQEERRACECDCVTLWRPHCMRQRIVKKNVIYLWVLRGELIIVIMNNGTHRARNRWSHNCLRKTSFVCHHFTTQNAYLFSIIFHARQRMSPNYQKCFITFSFSLYNLAEHAGKVPKDKT